MLRRCCSRSKYFVVNQKTQLLSSESWLQTLSLLLLAADLCFDWQHGSCTAVVRFATALYHYLIETLNQAWCLFQTRWVRQQTVMAPLWEQSQKNWLPEKEQTSHHCFDLWKGFYTAYHVHPFTHYWASGILRVQCLAQGHFGMWQQALG